MKITRKEVVDDEERSLMFFRHFPEHFTLAEQLVFKWLDDHCDAYHGGYWSIYDLSNGGFYMAPVRDGSLAVRLNGQGKVALTPDQAGLCACMAVFDQLAADTGRIEIARLATRVREYADFKGNENRKMEVAIG